VKCPLFRELDGITQQIGQNLPQAQRVALKQIRNVRCNMAAQQKPLFSGPGADHGSLFGEQP